MTREGFTRTVKWKYTHVESNVEDLTYWGTTDLRRTRGRGEYNVVLSLAKVLTNIVWKEELLTFFLK